MNNERSITFTASNVEADAGERAVEFDALEDFCDTLRALGLEVETEKMPRNRVKVQVRYPFDSEAERARTRGAGRRVAFSPYSSPVFNSETTAVDALGWLEGHTPEEGMEALGCSRSTYFRWLKRLKGRVAERAEQNAKRAERGMAPLPLSLTAALSRKS